MMKYNYNKTQMKLRIPVMNKRELEQTAPNWWHAIHAVAFIQRSILLVM